jgi:predicted acyl esterase
MAPVPASSEGAGTEENVWIPMPDGVRLAATLYLPAAAPPYPAVLEALPYRKEDVTAYDTPEYRRVRDEGGYAVCRLDLRGTGSSEGIATDEYPSYEQRDLCDVIAWLASQEWCTGAVGMYGTSYSGFNSIQVAMERPPALKAIIAIYATDDRYTDDVHYGGGVRRALDLADYPLYMVAMNALPPVPKVFGEGWREEWERRVEDLDPWIMRWLRKQVDSDYWRHGSLRPDYDRITCATMIVGGWADGYRNATLRAFERLVAPKRLLIGPWAHASTETSLPGPHIDLVPEMIRWWDRHLRNVDNGIDDEPPITVFVRHPTPPAGDLGELRGSWRQEAGWPLDRGFERALPLDDAIVQPHADDLPVRGYVGADASIWCAGSLPFGQPLDQRADATLSLVYEWPEQERSLEILGHPRVEITIASDTPVAFLSAKLCDVFPDGTTALVSRALLNLTHRDSHRTPAALETNHPYDVTVELDATSWVFEPGHRIALHIAGADWPNLWPPPRSHRIAVGAAGSVLVLPVVGDGSGAGEPRFRDPPKAPSRESAHPRPSWRIEHDVLAHQKRVSIENIAQTDLEIGGRLTEEYIGAASVSVDDPGDSRVEGRARFLLEWPEATAGAEVRMTIRSDHDDWDVRLQLDVSDNGETKWTREWQERFPRELA